MTTKTVQSSCEHNALIRRQFMKIESLESELAVLRAERDSLLGENERLCFQLQCFQSIDRQNDRSDDQRRQTTSRDTVVELSQQLIDRRVDALERKYGGVVARHSATTIQRAFRAYRLQKRFQSIALEALKTKSQTKSQSHRPEETSVHAIEESLTPCVVQQHECERKRRYRVGLNLLNKRADKGIAFLARHGFLESQSSAPAVARFLLTRKGVSKAVIGDYLADHPEVLKHFARELDFSGLPIDCALRKFQTFFRFPGEAQKIERIVDSFATRYSECNSELQVARDSVFILAFAIIMLNTDLHAPTNARNRMTGQQWLTNVARVFQDNQFSEDFLLEVYQRIKSQELRTGADHVTQVSKVQSALIAQRGQQLPNLCLESRRLVCYCRLYEIREQKRDSKDRHQREVFLFNDLLLVTKLSARAKNQMPEYVFRQSLPLEGLTVELFETSFHRFAIDVRRQNRRLLCFNARNNLDQKRFAEDLKESILETDEMETLRMTKASSLLALNEQQASGDSSQPSVRRKSSSGSLDSGLSLPSRDHSPQTPKTSQ